ncbi:MAG: SelB C-terminal domain-containing protein [Acidobacteriota bacterium]
MKIHHFDALLFFLPPKKGSFQGQLRFRDESSLATFMSYPQSLVEDNQIFVRVITDKSFSLKWKERFQVYLPEEKNPAGEGLVLYPDKGNLSHREKRRRAHFLPRLAGTKEEMVCVLADERGINGLREDEILFFARIEKGELLSLAQKLEAEGRIRILSFAPLLLYSVKSRSLLEEKLLNFLSDFHQKNPGELGVSREQLRRKFKVPSRLDDFVLTHLLKENKIVIRKDYVALKDFRLSLSPEEQEVLMKLEKMTKGGELRSVSLEDIQNRFHLPPKRLNMLLSILAERKKIIQGKEGFYLHADWLQELIRKLRTGEKKEITVSEFKEITGLTRKYAIPLLELLDRMGVTRRSGPSTREIIKPTTGEK